VVLITGATRGIGLAIARALAAEGCDLILTGRDKSALTRIGRELGSKRIRIVVHACDVRDPNSVDSLFQSVRGQFKRIDILINNAGIAHKNLPVERLPYPVWKEVIETNLDGMFLVTQGAMALMKRGGTIVSRSPCRTRIGAFTAAIRDSESKRSRTSKAAGTKG